MLYREGRWRRSTTAWNLDESDPDVTAFSAMSSDSAAQTDNDRSVPRMCFSVAVFMSGLLLDHRRKQRLVAFQLTSTGLMVSSASFVTSTDALSRFVTPI